MIDIVEVKAAIRSGKLSVQVKNGSLLMKDSLSGEAVKLSDLHYAPAVHARWIECDNGGYFCSRCDHRIAFLMGNRFCFNCGARMDGDGW